MLAFCAPIVTITAAAPSYEINRLSLQDGTTFSTSGPLIATGTRVRYCAFVDKPSGRIDTGLLIRGIATLTVYRVGMPDYKLPLNAELAMLADRCANAYIMREAGRKMALHPPANPGMRDPLPGCDRRITQTNAGGH